MVIVFYIARENKICVCTQDKPMKLFAVDDPNLLSFIPNDDIYYVQNCSILTKKQLQKWLNGELNLETTESEKEIEEIGISDKKYIHPVNNFVIIIDSIRTPKYPNGLKLKDKYDFVALEDLGDNIEDNALFKSLLRTRKIEIVDSDYVRKNMHKANRKLSPADAALNKILVPVGINAEDVAERGGMGGRDDDDFVIPVKVR